MNIKVNNKEILLYHKKAQRGGRKDYYIKTINKRNRVRGLWWK